MEPELHAPQGTILPGLEEEAPTAPPTAGRLRRLPDVIRACQEQEIPAVVVGRWVWVAFEERPSEEIRRFLKITGFRWVKNREAWAHNCGHYSKRGHGDPRDKYGAIPVNQFDLEATQ